MNPFLKLFGFLTNQVRVREITKVRVLGTVYPLVATTSYDISEKYKMTYTIRKTMMVNEESARDYDEFVEVEEMDIQEFISEWIWVPKDSFPGMLSNVTFDPEKLRIK